MSYREGAQALMDDGNVVGAVLFASMGATQETTNMLLDNLRQENAELKAELMLIRTAIEDLMNQPHIPHPGYVLAALHPMPSAIKRMAREMEGNA